MLDLSVVTTGDHMVITSSDQNRNYQGVGLIISKNRRKSVMSYNAVSSRIVTIGCLPTCQ